MEDRGKAIKHLKVHTNFVVDCFDFICTSIMLCVALRHGIDEPSLLAYPHLHSEPPSLMPLFS